MKHLELIARSQINVKLVPLQTTLDQVLFTNVDGSLAGCTEQA